MFQAFGFDFVLYQVYRTNNINTISTNLPNTIWWSLGPLVWGTDYNTGYGKNRASSVKILYEQGKKWRATFLVFFFFPNTNNISGCARSWSVVWFCNGLLINNWNIRRLVINNWGVRRLVVFLARCFPELLLYP